MNPTRETARLIFKAGVKVEVFIEEIWFPATIIEDFGNNLFLVEYDCSGINGESKLCKITVDHLHIRPSVSQVRVSSFGLLEKVDAFVDFGWSSGVVTKKLADCRYVVYFKNTNKAKEVSHLDLRPHVEWKNQVPVSNGVEHDEIRETVSLNVTNAIEDVTTCIDKRTSIVTTSMKRSKPTNLASNLKPSKKSKAGISSDDPSLSNGSQTKEVSNQAVGQTSDKAENISGVKKKAGWASKKSKAGISSDDPGVSNGGQSKEVSNSVVGQTSDKAENVSSTKKKLGKRAKGVELKRHVITPAKKKGKLSVDSKGPKTLPQAAGDSTLTTTPNVVEKKHDTETFPIRVIVGLQCYAITGSKSKKSKQLTSKTPQSVETKKPKQLTSKSPQSVETKKPKQLTSKSPQNVETKKPKQLTSKSPQKVVELEEPQSGVPLSPNSTGKQRTETDGDTTTKKKRGRSYKTQPKTPSTVNNQNGDARVKKVPYRSGIELPLQPEKYDKPVKGKRGKRRMISLNNTSSPPQDVQDTSKQKENGNPEINIEKSLDTVSDDQPLARWFVGKQALATLESTGKKPPENSKSLPIVTNGDGQSQTLTFEKRSALWETIESMEALRLFPQKPHFRPLDNIKESARERHAINKMVDFSSVYEDTCRLRIDHPRTSIEDHLETLLELETHGFDVSLIRNRLMKLVSFKDKQEGLGSQSKEIKDSIRSQRVEVQKLDKEIESLDKQVADLMKKRDRVLKEKEKKDSEIVGLEGEIGEIEEGMREYSCKFDELATVSFV